MTSNICLVINIINTAADIVVSTEHTIDGRVVDVKRAVPRDMAPAPTRYMNTSHQFP